MPTQKDHLAKAVHDEEFVSSLKLAAGPFVDWAITGLFYAGLHYVEAYFAKTNRHSVDHRARDSAIRRDAALAPIYNAYNDLKNYSINARYYAKKFTETDVVRTVEPRLQAIKTHVLSLL